MLNKVTLIGNLGSDPDLRFMPTGNPVAQISLATTRRWKDKQSGERQEHTEWHRLVFYNRLAEIARDYLKKGSKIYVDGRLQTRKWQGQDGQDHYTTEIIVGEMHMLDSRQGTDSGAPAGNKYDPPQMKTPAPAGDNFDGFDDDIQF